VENCTVVDLFCGAGGLTHGFVLEGFTVAAGIDSDTTCEYAFEQNNNGAKFIGKKLEDVTAKDISSYYPEGHIKILVGCAPCQPFSSANTKRPENEKWRLLEAFADLIEAIQPEIVSMENVLQLKSFNKGSVFNQFVKRLEKLNYHVSWYRAYGPDYGMPQRRRRLVLFASKLGNIELTPPTHAPEKYITVKDVLKDLPELAAGEISKTDPLHRAAQLSPKLLERIRASKPGGTWKDWSEHLIADCHKRESGSRSIGVYGRMSWDELSPTITTQFHGFGSGRFGHPEQDRALSLREGALLQTFPSNYEFIRSDEKYSLESVARHIGNAVPVTLGKVIAKSIKKHLDNYQESNRESNE
jgi:DNA (cytosine-5)-methyltransferase 1